MNFTLLAKELRGLRLCIALVLGTMLVAVCFSMISGFVDREPFVVDEVDPMGMLFGLLIGVQVLSQEREQQTQAFLDGLPVGRWAVFFHKTLAALIVVAFTVLSSLACSMLMGWLSHNSQSASFSWQQLAVINSLRLLLGIAVVAVSMLLSYSRAWFPLLAGLIFWAFLWMRAHGGEWTEWFDSYALFHPDTDDDDHMLVPWTPVKGHAALAFGAWLAAAIAFQWRDGSLSRFIERLSAWRLSGWLAGVGRLAAVVVWIYAFTKLADETGSSSSHERAESSAAGSISPPKSGAATKAKAGTPKADAAPEVVGFDTLQSRYYEIVFRESQRKAVRRVFSGLDKVRDEAASFFQNPSLSSDRIVIDVASLVVRHAAGQTNWTKIRIPLEEAADSAEFRQILRHETAHVYIEQLSEGLASAHFNAMRAFHEGMATAVELSVADDEEAGGDRLRMERWAAATIDRGAVAMEVLCDDAKLSAKRDPAVVYPLGFVFARSLIQAGGPTLPRRVLESLHQSPSRTGAGSSELWRHVLQKCGVSYDLVAATYDESLAGLLKREKNFLGRFPRLKGSVTIDGDEIVIHPEQEAAGPVPAKMVCMVDEDLGVAHVPKALRAKPDGTFRLSRAGHSSGKVKYMLGWGATDLRYPYFEPWETSVAK